MAKFNLKLLAEYKEGLDRFENSCTAVDEAIDKNVTQPELEVLVIRLADEFRWINERISWIQDDISKHLRGHFPAIPSTEQMQRALKILKLDKEYKVEPKVIYSNIGSKTYAVIG